MILRNHQHTVDSIICSLVSATVADIDCVERFRDSCDETALELFSPMRSETEQVLIDHNCAASTPDVNEEFSTTPIRTSTSTTSFIPEKVTPKIRVPDFLQDLDDVLSVLNNLDGVCQRHLNPNNAPDLWAPVRVKICHKKQELKIHSNCFEETAAKLNGNCPGNVSFYF